MLEWINPGPLPLFVEDAANVFPLQRDGPKSVVIGIGNLTPDTLPRLTFRVAPFSKGTPRLESLSSRKPVVNQQKHQDGYWRFQVVCAVPPLELACFKITVR